MIEYNKKTLLGAFMPSQVTTVRKWHSNVLKSIFQSSTMYALDGAR